MAVTAVIDIRVQGQRELTKLQKQTKLIRTLIDGIKPVPSLFDRTAISSTRGLNKLVRELKTNIAKLATTQKAHRGTTASLNRQLDTQRKLLSNLARKGTEWRQVLVGVERAQVAVGNAERKTMEQRMRTLKSGGSALGRDIVSEVLASSNQIANSKDALNSYREELVRLFNAVEIGGKEYKSLSSAIKEVDDRLNTSKAQTKKPLSRIQGLDGLQLRDKSLKEALRIQNQLEAGTEGHIQAVIGVRQAQHAYNKELERSKFIQNSLNFDLIIWKKLLDSIPAMMNKVVGGMGGLLSGKAGRLGQASGIIIISDLIHRLVNIIPLLDKGLRGNIQHWARWTQRVVEGITGATLAYTGLSSALSAAAWVSGAISGFVRFERAAVETFHKVNAARIRMEKDDSAFQQKTLLQNLFGPVSQMVRGRMGNKLKEIYGGKDAGFDEGGAFRGMSDRTPYGERLANELENAREALSGLRSDNDKFADQVQKVITLESRVTDEIEKQNKIKEETLAVQRKLQSMEARDKDPNRKNKETEDQIAAGIEANKNFEKKMKQIQEEREARLQLIRDEQEALRKKFRQEAQARGKQSRQKMQAIGRFGENVMLGAGFPMLFGGGVGSVAGGLTGAVSQSAMGSKGFGAQILFSAVGQQLDAFAQKARELGDALKRPSDALSALADMGLVVDKVFQKEVETLVSVGREAEAMVMVNKELARTIGTDGIQQLKNLDTAWDSMGDQLAKIKLKVMTDLVPVALAVIKLVEKFVSSVDIHRVTGKAQELDPKAFDEAKLKANQAALEYRRREIQNNPELSDWQKKMTSARATMGTSTNTRRFYDQKLYEFSKDIINTKAPGILGLEDTGGFGGTSTTGITIGSKQRNLEEEIKLLQKSLEIGSKAAGQEQEAAMILQEQNKLRGTSLKLEDTDILQQVKKRDALKDQLELWTKIKDTLASGITNAITGLIQGTKTLGESLSGIIGQIGQIIMQTAISKWVGGWFGAEGGYNTAGGFKAFAQGGVTTGPTLGLIGEAGEPEYVIPASKMEGAMGRYSAGARGQGVIPGGGTVASGSGVAGGSVQIDYTGPILSFNSEDYVPRSAIPEIVNGAARRGAAAGSARVFSQLKNSRSQRSKIGL